MLQRERERVLERENFRERERESEAAVKLRVLSFLFFDVAEKKGGRERERQGLGWVEVVFDGFYGRNGVRGCVRVGL